MRAHSASFSLRLVTTGAAMLSLAACTVRPDDFLIDGQDIELVFMHTGDIHSRLVPYDLDVGETDKAMGLLQANAPFGGMSRLSSLVRQERQNHDRFAYVETGDVFQGAPIFNIFGGKPEFIAMTEMGVDVFAIGNHEFDNGAAHLVEKATAYANFPMLAANYILEDPDAESGAPTGRIAQPYVVLNLKGLRVGVIGFGSISSMRSIFKGGNSQGITPLRTLDILQQYVDYLRPQVDLVVLVAHLGYHDDLEIIPRTEGIDIVFDGHLHIALDPPSVIQDCDISKLNREKDRYDCATEAKLRQVARSCESKEECDSKSDEEKAACQAGCEQEAKDRCARETESFNYKTRLQELDDDIDKLQDRDCHPRDVILVHSGAFLKYAGRLQVTVRQCTRLEQREICVEYDDAGDCIEKRPRRCVGRNGGRDDWEVISHKYDLIPIDSRLPEDPQMLQLLEPYLFELNRQSLLTQVVGYTANRVRRFSSGSGDSQLGNMVANAMQMRNQVWADFSVTNSLGIRSDMVIGPVDREQMTNVFPFENAITLMYLSGHEVQEMLDFIAQRSTFRGCQSQAQVSGLTAVLNCGGCPGNGGNRCLRQSYEGEACAQRVTIGGSGRPCKADTDCETCSVPPGVPKDVEEAIQEACAGRANKKMGEICTGQRHPSFEGYTRCWLPISCSRSYKLATNDYIARGGSGFQVLERNTTQQNLGIGLRQAAIDFMRAMPACGEKPARSGFQLGSKSVPLLTKQERASLENMEDLARDSNWSAVNDQFKTLSANLRTRRDESDDGLEKAGLTNYLYCSDLDCTCLDNDDCSYQGGGYTCDRGLCVRNGVTRCNGLAFRLVRQCREYLIGDLCKAGECKGKGKACEQRCKQEALDRDKCEALGRVHAARRCMTLPCINAKEDGRLQRIFKDSSGSPNPFEPWPE